MVPSVYCNLVSMIHNDMRGWSIQWEYQGERNWRNERDILANERNSHEGVGFLASEIRGTYAIKFGKNVWDKGLAVRFGSFLESLPKFTKRAHEDINTTNRTEIAPRQRLASLCSSDATRGQTLLLSILMIVSLIFNHTHVCCFQVWGNVLYHFDYVRKGLPTILVLWDFPSVLLVADVHACCCGEVPRDNGDIFSVTF